MNENKEKTTENTEENYANYSDSDLIFEITKKNNRAFEEFFKRYAEKVKFLMLKMGAKDVDAEEISQEVMAILWRKADLFDSKKCKSYHSSDPAFLRIRALCSSISIQGNHQDCRGQYTSFNCVKNSCLLIDS